MLKIGCHLSSTGGYLNMGKTALSIGANVFQFFTRNPRGGKAKETDPRDVAAFSAFASENGIGPVLAHAPYTMNLCSAKPETREFSVQMLREDLEKLENLPGVLYNFHPGSHVGQGAEKGVELIADALDRAVRPDGKTTVLLETMAGKGSEIGGNFGELREILEEAACREKLGVCLDTCHVFDGGYDIVNDLEGVLDEFDRVIGLEKLKAIHLNDSKNALNSRKDRHEKLGEGNIGLEAFERIINHPALRGLPFYLETPNELPGYAREIKILEGLYRK